MTSHSYYVALMDYGRLGYEALPVSPEFTLRNVADEIIKSRTGELVHVKRIDGDSCEDVTDDARKLIADLREQMEVA